MWGRVLLDPLTQQHPPLCLPNVADMGEPYVSSETQGELHETHWGSGFSHQFLANFNQWEKGNKLKKPEGKFLALCSPLILHRAFLPYVLSSSSLLSCSQTQWFHGLSGDLPSSMTNQPAVLSAEALAPWTTYSFVFLSFLPALLPCPSHPGFPAVLPSNKEYTWHTLKNMPLFVRQANLRYFENINFHH